MMKIVLLVCCIVSLVVFASCNITGGGDNNSTKPQGSEEPLTEKVEIVQPIENGGNYELN